VAARLEDRRAEIERALLDRIYGIADPTEVDDPAYIDGFRGAVAAAFDYALATLATSPRQHPLIPPAIVSQARLAARHGVSLDTVLRRYMGGHALMVDFLIEEADREEAMSPAELRRLLASTSSAFDRLLATVGEEHERGSRSRAASSPEGIRTELVRRILAGEPLDPPELDYPLTGWHVGAVATGCNAKDQLQRLARKADLRLLVVRPDGGKTWAWLGGKRRTEAGELLRWLREAIAPGVTIAFGEPGQDRAGWRLSHEQAKAVAPLAERGGECVVRYGDLGLIASVLKDEVLVRSLQSQFLAPLIGEPGGDNGLRESLEAYFSADRNITSGAAALKLNRQTLRSRLRAAERKIGQPLSECAVELDIALRVARCTEDRPGNLETSPRLG
jgi:hypothetical protein